MRVMTEYYNKINVARIFFNIPHFFKASQDYFFIPLLMSLRYLNNSWLTNSSF